MLAHAMPMPTIGRISSCGLPIRLIDIRLIPPTARLIEWVILQEADVIGDIGDGGGGGGRRGVEDEGTRFTRSAEIAGGISHLGGECVGGTRGSRKCGCVGPGLAGVVDRCVAEQGGAVEDPQGFAGGQWSGDGAADGGGGVVGELSLSDGPGNGADVVDDVGDGGGSDSLGDGDQEVVADSYPGGIAGDDLDFNAADIGIQRCAAEGA